MAIRPQDFLATPPSSIFGDVGSLGVLGDSRDMYYVRHGAPSGQVDWASLTRSLTPNPPQPVPPSMNVNPEPTTFSEQEIDVRSELVRILLEVEKCRCQAMKDFDDRDDAFAGLLEGDDRVVQRISAGLDRYMELIFKS